MENKPGSDIYYCMICCIEYYIYVYFSLTNIFILNIERTDNEVRNLNVYFVFKKDVYFKRNLRIYEIDISIFQFLSEFMLDEFLLEI